MFLHRLQQIFGSFGKYCNWLPCRAGADAAADGVLTGCGGLDGVRVKDIALYYFDPLRVDGKLVRTACQHCHGMLVLQRLSEELESDAACRADNQYLHCILLSTS